MKEFTVYFEHPEYGYYTANIDGENINDSLDYFRDAYNYTAIYGIMLKR